MTGSCYRIAQAMGTSAKSKSAGKAKPAKPKGKPAKSNAKSPKAKSPKSNLKSKAVAAKFESVELAPGMYSYKPRLLSNNLQRMSNI